MTTSVHDYWYYGLRLCTDLPLTLLPRWPGPPGAPDIHLVPGDVPERLDQPAWANAGLAIDGAGNALVRQPGLFRLLARAGRHATIALETPDVPMTAVESCLLGRIAGVLLHQRGAVPLHASSVVIGGRAIAFTGPSGRGKSTIAAALVAAGHRLLSDDVTVTSFREDGGIFATPGSPHLRLRADALALASPDPAMLIPSPLGEGKKIWRRAAGDAAPVPLGAVIRLDAAPPGAGPALIRLAGPRAVLPMNDLVYRFALGRRLGRAGALTCAMFRLASDTPIYRLARVPSLETLPSALAMLRHVALHE